MRSVSRPASLLLFAGTAAADAPPIAIINSTTPTEELPVKPGVYVGQTITFDDAHEGETVVRASVWEADVSKTRLIDIRSLNTC